MSLIKGIQADPFDYAVWATSPSKLLDQHFDLGLDPEDLLRHLNITNSGQTTKIPSGYLRSCRSNSVTSDTDGETTAVPSFQNKSKFQVNLDVQHFRPEDISINVRGDNMLTIECKHDERQDDHGYISRHFVRRYVLPENGNMGNVECKLSSDGVLTVTAAAHTMGKIEAEDRKIPILETGELAKRIDDDQKT